MKSSGKIDKEASAKAMIASWPKYSAELNTKISNKCYDQGEYILYSYVVFTLKLIAFFFRKG